MGHWALDKQDLKEKLIILSVTTGMFLPLRLVFVAFVSDHWIGSMGFATAFGIGLIYLVKKNKLGWFGRMFENQIRKTITGKTGKYVLVFAFMFLIYFGSSMYFMDKGNSTYVADKEIFQKALVEDKVIRLENIPKEELKGPEPLFGMSGLTYLTNLDYALSISFAIMDDTSDGWLGHLVVVIFVEQLELIGLIYLYRRTFKKEIPLQTNS